MIEFPRDPQNVIPTTAVKILGIGGAGANMIDRVALDGLDGAEMLALNTDVRTLSGSVAGERIQLGRNLTKGLGTGGDPELGYQAVQEAEDEIRAAIKGRKIIFICVGLGGGTGSGAAPVVARVAREEGAFVVMFATMPFTFEGRRRREQAETALNELAVLSNALVTFDNSRMGELVLAKQGIHEAFAAGDRMISESIKAVIRLVVRPGLINIGLDDLMSALRTTRSRCLFGSGIARGKDRAQKALRNALNSPLLDQGALLKEADTVLVHLCGGEDLTLFEIELLMESLGKHVPAKAHVLFGAAVDPGMEDQLSITLVSSLPEEQLRRPGEEEAARAATPTALDPSIGFEPVDEADGAEEADEAPAADAGDDGGAVAEEAAPASHAPSPGLEPEEGFDLAPEDEEAIPTAELVESPAADEDRPFTPTEGAAPVAKGASPEADAQADAAPPQPPRQPAPETTPRPPAGPARAATPPAAAQPTPAAGDQPPASPEPANPEPRAGTAQTELSFEGGPKGRFEGSDPSVFEGEDLDVPAFLRKKKNP
jgi:cell division protein FtsZ